MTNLGCAGSDELPPSPTGGPPPSNITGGGPDPGYTSLATGACAVEDAVRACHVTVGQHAGITNCFHGIQRCRFGVWTDCVDGEYSVMVSAGRTDAELVDALAKPEGRKLADGLRVGPADKPVVVPGADGSLAQVTTVTTGSCNDACDPTCQKITEGGPFATGGQSVSSWAQSTKFALANAKSGLLGKLWTEPCTTGFDCEFGMHCVNPITANQGTGAGQCAHDKCAAGAALDAACGDVCVAAVCATNPNCCTYTGSCAHSPCVTGAALTCNTGAGLDPAVATVCSTPGFTTCCTSGWNASCVAQYGIASGVTCPSNPNYAWDSPAIDPAVGAIGMTCTQLVHDQCGVICPNTTPTCEHDLCAVGGGMTGACDSCVAAVCATAGGAGCCGATGTWSQACIDLIPVACGKACTPSTGVCQDFLPNQVDTSCLGPDLVTGVPCYDPGTVATPSNAPPQTNCTTDNQCGANTNSGYICSGGTCVAGCRNGTGCQSGTTCNSTNNSAGQCIQYKVPTATSAQSYVTVCNHGTQATPMGAAVTINVYSGNSGQPNKFQGSPTNKAPNFTCSTLQVSNPPPQVLPGKCVDVPCPTGTNDEIYVNPPNPTAPYSTTPQVTECAGKPAAYKNNWSLNLDTGNAPANKISCDAPSCSPTIGTIRSLNTHMVIEAENSSLMPAGEWNGIRTGLVAYFATQLLPPWSNANTYAAVGYFPDTLTSCTATGVGSCKTPPACVRTNPGMVPITTSSGALGAALTSIVPPAGNPPPYITALAGALDAARTDQLTQAANNGWNQSVVLILGSDLTAAGNNYCGTNLTAMTGLAAQYWALYGIRTFVIAVGPAKLSTATAIANAGNGYGYYVANDINLSTNLLAAIKKAHTFSNSACTYDLPATALFDMNASKVSFWSPLGPTSPNYRYNTITAATQVQPASSNWSASFNTYLEACLANCGNLTPPTGMPGGTTKGWCYDDPAAPTAIVFCQNTCEAISTDPWASNTVGGSAHSQTFFRLGCPQYYPDNNFTPLGPYLGSYCDNIPGSKPLWSYFGYDTLDPPQTSVKFQFSTANRVNGACPAVAAFPAPVSFSVTATPTNQACMPGMTGCPIDLVQNVQGGDIDGPMLADCMNLTFTLTTNPQHTLSPTVNSYELRYSCPYTE